MARNRETAMIPRMYSIPVRFMHVTKPPKKIILAAIVIVAAFFLFFVSQVIYLRIAHSTFENYYAFRGCVQLLQRTDTFGICKIQSGQTIKIVKYQGEWYLDGDLPTWFFGHLL